jgi:hypothetical protein
MRLPRVRLTVKRMVVLIAVTAGALWYALRLSDPYPAGWDVVEFRSAVKAAVDPEGKGKVDIELLAWHTMEDDRPRQLRVDCGLAWSRVETRRKVRWALVFLFRHPKKGPRWRLSFITDVPWHPVRYFERPPGNDEIYAFVDSEPGDGFFKKPSSGFRNLSAAVRVMTWNAVVGERPTRFFP